MLRLDTFLLQQFERNKARYKDVNKYYYDTKELMLFKQAVNVFLERETLKVSKSGLTYLRYLTYYLNKLLLKLTDLNKYDQKNLSKDEIFKYAYKVTLSYFRILKSNF
jgi:hypothetical protein